ncbi:AraC family transcriptional regulator, partial [Lactobacillus delbrueckii]
FVGYNDSFTFSKAFKRYQGLSPKSWRQIKNAGN